MSSVITKGRFASTERYVGIIVVLVLLLIVFSLAYFAEASGYKQSGQLEKTPETFYLRGDLTAKTENKMYGGEIIGDYLITVNFDRVKILAFLDQSSQKKILEGWLVDKTSGKTIKVGTFNDGKLESKIIVESWTYEEILIKENLGYNENIQIGGDLLKRSQEYQSCKCS